MFYVVRFIITWTVWFIFADKRRWRELFLVSIFAGVLGFFADTSIHHYRLWSFQGINPWLADIIDEFGLYTVVPYLFIQWLPKQKTFWNLFKYWFIWTGISIGIEWIHTTTGYMHYYKWWNIGFSYVCDWLIFVLLYVFYKIFHLEQLSR